METAVTRRGSKIAIAASDCEATMSFILPEAKALEFQAALATVAGEIRATYPQVMQFDQLTVHIASSLADAEIKPEDNAFSKPETLFDAWLRYNGIIGYTEQIVEMLDALRAAYQPDTAFKCKAFHSGRQYSNEGQRIAYYKLEDGHLAFFDLDRQITGVTSYACHLRTDEGVRHWLIAEYDAGRITYGLHDVTKKHNWPTARRLELALQAAAQAL